MFSTNHCHTICSGFFSLAACAAGATPRVEITADVSYPISRIARAVNSQLIHTEKRISAIQTEIAGLAAYREQPLKTALGFRACRAEAGGADPSVTLDLRKNFPLETIFLIPAQNEFFEESGIFPKRFTLEVSNHADFAERTVIFSSGSQIYPAPAASPASFAAGTSGRYVRLTVHEGHDRGVLDLFGLSEIVVIANHEPVSFQASATSTGALEVPGIWSVSCLVDGRTPLGIWQNGNCPSNSVGDLVQLDRPDEQVTWTLQLAAAAPLDRIVIFPYQLRAAAGTSVIPDTLSVTLINAAKQENPVTYVWSNPLPGASQVTPLIFPLNGDLVSTVRITGVRPYPLGEKKIAALSEIEAWSNGQNLAANLPIQRSNSDRTTSLQSLTDGFTSEQKILPIQHWLEQLSRRRGLENELAVLKPLYQQLSSEGELNATWGAAVGLGLTFLIPIFMLERRRLSTRNQLDQLRKRIASDLHDDIGSNLGSISLIARSARQDLERGDGSSEVAEDLGQVESIARESSLAMRDIVWLLERKQDSIGDLVLRMRETAGRLLREIDFTLECDSKKTTARLSLDAKRHLFLFYKEAIHNVLKHSHASRVAIRLWDENDQLGLEVQDNGIGIPTDPSANLLAVRKLEERARILDGHLKIASSEQTGTQICLLVKRSHLIAHPTLS
jgi:signal transduction histidine kinase